MTRREMSNSANGIISTQTRNEVWSEYYGAEFAWRYYRELASAFQRKHIVMQWLTVILGGGAALPSITLPFANSASTGWFGWWIAFHGVSLAIVTVINIIGDFGSKAAISNNIAKFCGRVSNDFRDLFFDVDSDNQDEASARERLKYLTQLKSEITNSSEPAGIQVSSESRESKTAAIEAIEHLQNIYNAHV